MSFLDWKEEETNWNNHYLLPSEVFRCLIIGESNCGKTCLLFKLLLDENWINYEKLIFVGDSLYQEKYKIIQACFEAGLSKELICTIFKEQDLIKKNKIDKFQIIKGLGLKNKNRNDIECVFIASEEPIPDPSEIDKSVKTVIVFDDVINKKNQETMKAWFTRGRHANTIVFYLSQSYFALDRKLIRANSNFLILFKLSERDLQNLHRDRVAIDMNLEEFRDFCNEEWKKQYGFVVIDFTANVLSGRKYRFKFNRRYIPISYIN